MIFININIYNVIFIKISDMLDFYKYQGGCPAPGGRVVIFIKIRKRVCDIYKAPLELYKNPRIFINID